MNIHGFGVTDEVDTPDFLQQLIATPDALGVLNEQLEDLVFLGGEGQIRAIPGDPAFTGIQAQVGVSEGMRLGGRRLRLTGSPQQGPAAGHQLAQPKGFDQVIVGAHLKPQHPIGLTVSGADHQDRGGVVDATELAAKVKPPQAGEHQIEHDQIHRI